MLRLMLVAALGAALIACGNDKDADDDEPTSAGPPPPAATLEALFAAARAGDAESLPGLCDPQGESDPDTTKLCEMKPGTREWDDFRTLFSEGAITGETTIEGDRATVPFKFGPVRGYKQNMTLILRDNRWYMLSM